MGAGVEEVFAISLDLINSVFTAAFGHLLRLQRAEEGRTRPLKGDML